jgi:hypothetical protein
MKKFLLILVLLWIAFLCFIIFKDKIEQFLSNQDSGELDSITQVKEDAPNSAKESVEEKQPVIVLPKPVEENPVPFDPLPPVQMESRNEEAKSVAKNEGNAVEKKLPDPRGMVIADYDKDPFGLICTKFERVPSRFRLLSWEGTKRVVLQDLENYDYGTKAYPRYIFNIRQPYKEMRHAKTGKPRFVPCSVSDPNKRILLQSINIKHEAQNFSALTKPLAYLVIRDFKFGGTPYQITNEMEKPLTASYAIEVEQFNGPQKFFHDLTGKPRNHTFGGWGFEYKLIGQSNADRTLTIQRKELKTGKITRKEISWGIDVP